MDAGELRAMQAPIKERYKGDPKAAFITLKAKGTLDDNNIACKVETGRALAIAGLHPATGGSGLELCSGDMLLEALVACAGVTVKAVATALDIAGRRCNRLTPRAGRTSDAYVPGLRVRRSRCRSTRRRRRSRTAPQVLLKVLAAGVCHSDLHLADGYFDLGGGKRLSLQDRGMKLPVTLGHENVGEVVAVGPDAKGVKVGQNMLANPWIGCGVCAVCQRGDDNLCRAMRSLGVFTNGGYATHMMVPHPRYLYDIGDLDPERAAPLACSGVTTYGALKKVADPENRADSDHRRRRTRPDVPRAAPEDGRAQRDRGRHRSGQARGAPRKRAPSHVIDGKAADAVKQIMALTNGAGAWAVIDLVGSSSSARLGYDSLIKGGKYIIVGLYGGDLTVSLPPIPMRALTIQGSYVGSQHGMKELMELVQRQGPAGSAGRHASARGRQRRARRAARRQGRRPRGADAGGGLM